MKFQIQLNESSCRNNHIYCDFNLCVRVLSSANTGLENSTENGKRVFKADSIGYCDGKHKNYVNETNMTPGCE